MMVRVGEGLVAAGAVMNMVGLLWLHPLAVVGVVMLCAGVVVVLEGQPR